MKVLSDVARVSRRERAATLGEHFRFDNAWKKEFETGSLRAKNPHPNTKALSPAARIAKAPHGILTTARQPHEEGLRPSL